ncbi:type II secretion system protein [Planctomycetales bacterium ZRK34]|nr:type II secretion system protein [Planctomycetales bacterium ZRK34]
MRRQAFTLIELLVVVAIIAMLIAILMPSLQRARTTTRTIVCQSNLRQYVIANELYANDFQNRYVPVRTADGEGTKGRNYDTWMHNTHYQKILSAPGALNRYSEDEPFLDCPDLVRKPVRGFSGSYGMVWSWVQPNWDTSLVVYRVDVKHPSEAAEIVDGTDWHIQVPYANYTTKWDINGEDLLWQVAYRHFEGEGVNVAHFDGSTKYVRKQEAWDDPLARKRLWVIYGTPP